MIKWLLSIFKVRCVVCGSVAESGGYKPICNQCLSAPPPKITERHKRGKELKEIYVLLADGDGTMRSCDEPFGVAVTTENEAKRYVAEKGAGFTHSYCKVTVFDNKDEALDFAFPSRKERREQGFYDCGPQDGS